MTTSDHTAEWDVFISHASEDKDEVARPLAIALQNAGLRVWFDEFVLQVGDSLTKSINNGLAHSRFGIIVISPHFLRKKWTQKELAGLVSMEDESTKVVLPIWHNITAEELRQRLPMIADLVAENTANGLDVVVKQLVRAIKLASEGSQLSHLPFDVPPVGELSLEQLLRDKIEELCSDHERRRQFRSFLGSLISAYSANPNINVELLQMADRHAWPTWAVECLPSLFCPSRKDNSWFVWKYIWQCSPTASSREVVRSLCGDQVNEVTMNDETLNVLQSIAPRLEGARRLNPFSSDRSTIGIVVDVLNEMEHEGIVSEKVHTLVQAHAI